MTKGSLSSSGVVHAIFDFYEFDEQVSAAISPECASRIRESTLQIQNLLGESVSSNQMVKETFKASYFEDDGDFYYMIADSAATSVQYGYQNILCGEYMLQQPSSDLYWQTFANFTTEFWYPVFNGGSPVSYTYEFFIKYNESILILF